ncbi:uncharacterized protein LOC126560427 [Anopheles maculipalpis]|uniref:uncharacterized protein LOC126560427 n=1 Tax=Anopheles maculipalpis TaxID=1496333 RepID=UPI0021591C0F|nr:uncharacterized protein LOC126560427 [Anopheles maculipalpis]
MVLKVLWTSQQNALLLSSVISEPFKIKHSSLAEQIVHQKEKMESILLALIILTGFYIIPICSGHLPYFNSQVSPSRVVSKQNYWYTYGSRSSAYHQKDNLAKWHQFPSKQADPLPWWNKISSPQYNALREPSSALGQTTKFSPPLPHQNRDQNRKVDDSSDISTLIYQLQQKLLQIEKQLGENGTATKNEPQKDPIDVTLNPNSTPKPIESSDNDPFWVQLDVVNKQQDPERLIKTIKILLENLKESTTPPAGDVSEENVYNLIDIRSNFLSR